MAESKFDPVPVLKALGCRTRFGIFKLLARKGMCVGAIANELGISQPAVSQHLRILKEAGAVDDDRCGYHVHYRVNRTVVRRTAEFLGNMEILNVDDPCRKGEEECSGSEKKHSRNCEKEKT